jgi:alpha-L-fucosidase 2
MSPREITRRHFIGSTLAGALAAGLPAGAAAAPFEGASPGLDDRMRSPNAWRRFLASQDMVWTRVPADFFEAPFMGNGGLAAWLYRHPSRQRVQLTLGDSRVHDHQDVLGPVTNLGQTAEMSNAVWGQARLRIGYLTLETAGDVTGVDLRLSLWDAELTGTVTTTLGTVVLRAFVHATEDLLVVELMPDAGERALAWSFTPYPAISPRAEGRTPPPGYQENPDPVVTTTPDGGECLQDLVAGGQTATAWRHRTDADGTSTLVATVAHTYPDASAAEQAARTADRGVDESVEELAGAHRHWWHGFYPRSFVSIPDARLQSFYWIQLYKMASATRADRPVIGTAGPWLEPTSWPATWWNLNVQLEYWLIHATGHHELDSLSWELDRYGDNLTLNVPEAYRADSAAIGRTTQEDLTNGSTVAVPGTVSPDALPEVGNLTWALHDAWLAYRHTMDDGVLRDLVYPLLRRAVNFYLHFLTEDADGRLHLPETFSPEYALARDCNYDLALLSWGCRTLLDSADRLGIADELRPRWRDVLNRLVDPPQGPDGLWIGADVPLTSSHRHYSHLLWFYPLYLFDASTLEQRDLLERSLAHWVGFSGALQGYTFTGAASMTALLGEGDRAHEYLDTLLDDFIQPNTMYKEGSSPVMETPLSGAQSLHDMLVQSHGGTIRVFPAVPEAWDDAVIHELRTEGAFLVSAARRGGRTQFVHVESLAGEPCRVAPGLPGPYEVRDARSGRPVTWRELPGGVLEIDLDRKAAVVIVTRGTQPEMTIAPVATDATGASWGLPR